MASMSGREALGTIQQAIKDEQRRTRELDASLSQANDRLVKLDVSRNEEIKALARWRIKYLESGDLVGRADEADRQAAALLERRRQELSALQQQLDGLEAERGVLESRRELGADALERAAAEVDAAEAATQARLANDPGHQAQVERARDAERIAVHADEKATLSEQEQHSKGESYRKDPLFIYLWNRKFGLPSYRARGLIRWLDGKVAKLIGFYDARPNYARLLEIPARLREHADDAGQRADAEFAKLKELDSQGRIDDGIPALEAARDEAAARLAELDAAIGQNADRTGAKLAELESYAKGEDQAYQQALGYLSSEYNRANVQALRQEATLTPFPEDDLIVARLLDLDAERESHSRTLEELKRVAVVGRERVSELEKIRRDFTSRQYDVPGSTFPNGAVIAAVIGQLISGALTTGAFWNVLQQQRRYQPPRSDPTFGSGGFGRGTIWGEPGKPNLGKQIGAEIVGEVIGGLLRGMGGASSRSGGGIFGGGGGNFGGTGRARSGGGGGSRGASPSPRSGGMGGKGGFKTGGKF